MSSLKPEEKSESYRLGLQPLLDEVLPVLAVPLPGVGGGVLRIRGSLGGHVHPSSPENHLLRRRDSPVDRQGEATRFMFCAF